MTLDAIKTDPDLDSRLEATMPTALGVGRGNALFLFGNCFHRERRIRRLAICAAGVEHPVSAHGMPRADVFRKLGSMRGRDPRGHSYRSGWWGFVSFPEGSSGPCDLELVATLGGGQRCRQRIGAIELEPNARFELPVPLTPAPEVAGPPDSPLIAICMATFNPPPELFKRQVDSIRRQSHENWVCVISDDGSYPGFRAVIEETLAGDPRFIVSPSPGRLGFYRNFERAIALTPEGADFVTLSDQDDHWHPDKLAELLSHFDEGTSLVYSDMNLTRPDGELIQPTYWSKRPNNFTDFTTLVIANTITGAASLFRRDLLELLLPFPQPIGNPYHDHWLAIVAMATGEVRYVDRSLYDYVQHSANVLGHATANRRREPRRLIPPFWRLLRPSRAKRVLGKKLTLWRRVYVNDVNRILINLRVLQLRGSDRLLPGREREIRRLLGIERLGAGFATLAWRGLRAFGRTTASLGREPLLLKGVLWRRIVGARARLRRKPRRHDRQSAEIEQVLVERYIGLKESPALTILERKVAPLQLDVRAGAPRRVNVLIPTLDVKHFFGGYIATFNLARRLAEFGLDVRVLGVDPPNAPLPKNWKRELERYEGLGRIPERMEFTSAHARRRPVEVSADDAFVASTWWTAHIAHHAVQDLGRSRFVYLIQEYEPFTFPMGTHAALARESYDLPHFALFSTDLLRGYFRSHGVGVFGSSNGRGDGDSVAFDNAITPVDAPSLEQMRRMPKRFLFYARPEKHAARNMFELGLMAIADLAQDGCWEGWDMHGIGALEPQAFELAGDVSLEISSRRTQDHYRHMLGGHAVGLALMYTPHPSLVPIEMAAAGMLVVTNTFENKTPSALQEISENLIAVPATLEGVKDGLLKAIESADDVERRVRGAKVNWSRDWEQSFADEKLAAVKRFIDAP